jgi:hypothetical protein
MRYLPERAILSRAHYGASKSCACAKAKDRLRRSQGNIFKLNGLLRRVLLHPTVEFSLDASRANPCGLAELDGMESLERV